MSTSRAVRQGAIPDAASDADIDLASADDRLHEEMQRLAAISQELLGNRPDSKESFQLTQEMDELTRLRGENADLRARVEELEQVLQATAADDSWAERQKEYEALMEEKSEVIRTLHMKIQELQEAGAAPAAMSTTESAEMARLKKEMAEQRQQLEEDEQAVMQQMRQMEMAMSRDRAELARQRNEVQRLHTELNREIEIASRDPGLRERLVALQRLQGEITGRKQPNTASPPPANSPAEPAPITPVPDKNKKQSGLFKRIFGK